MPKKAKPSENIAVSLLPDASRRAPAEHRGWTRMLWLICALLAVTVILTAAYFRIKAHSLAQQLQTRAKDLSALDEQVRAFEQRTASGRTLGRYIALAKTALLSHRSGLPLLEILESRAVEGVVLNQLNADAQGALIVSASAQTTTGVIRQILSWNQNPAITQVRVSGISNVFNKVGELTGVNFTATLSIATERLIFAP